ncbi:aldo/keto reductase [Rubripirellula amarantea]|nr:aldo/keto reductase [Rubripirellula amarantea]
MSHPSQPTRPLPTRPLGTHGPEVSEVGFGGWAIGGGWGPQNEAASAAALHLAIEKGITLIDTAAGYGDGQSERLIGQVLRDLRNQGRADNVFVATKTPPAPGPWPPSPYCRWQDRYSAAYLRENLEHRLKNLGTEKIDLLQLHTWTRAWNDDPQPLLVLRQLRDEGKIGLIGISTPEQDQSCVIQLMRDGLVDVVQVIFNLFNQEAAAQILPVAAETGTGVIVRVALDEGALTGKYSADHQFPKDDFRHAYFAGDRMARTSARVGEILQDIEALGLSEEYSLADVALKFVLARREVSSVVVGMRSVDQVTQNTRTSQLRDLTPETINQLRRHHWNRGVWYAGK